MYGDEWPLRVTGIASAAESEWRIGQQTPERTCEGWLLVYVKSGMVEELCDTHRVLLRAGQILFHQPAELFAMRAVGEVPPEVFRVEFTADGSAMDSFRSCHMRLGNAEKSCLRQLAETVREVFQPVQDACQMPARRAEIPFGGKELQTIYLAQLLYPHCRAMRCMDWSVEASSACARAMRRRVMYCTGVQPAPAKNTRSKWYLLTPIACAMPSSVSGSV